MVGELEEPNAYVDREGKPRASLEVTASTIRFLSARGEGGSASGAGQAANGSHTDVGHEMHDEDIPF